MITQSLTECRIVTQSKKKTDGYDWSVTEDFHVLHELTWCSISSEQIEVAVLKLLPSLDESPAGVEGLRIFVLLTELLHVIQRNVTPAQSIELAEKLAAAMHRLSAKNIQVLGRMRENCLLFWEAFDFCLQITILQKSAYSNYNVNIYANYYLFIRTYNNNGEQYQELPKLFCLHSHHR